MKNLIVISALVIIIGCIMAITSLEKSNTLTASKFYEKITAYDVQLVDIRTPKQFKSGHINNAINIDFNTGSFEESFNDFNPEKPIYLYCEAGVLSLQAVSILEKRDFKLVYDLEGGINSWKASGYNVVTDTIPLKLKNKGV